MVPHINNKIWLNGKADYVRENKEDPAPHEWFSSAEHFQRLDTLPSRSFGNRLYDGNRQREFVAPNRILFYGWRNGIYQFRNVTSWLAYRVGLICGSAAAATIGITEIIRRIGN